MVITKSKSVRFNRLTPAMAYMLYKLEQFHYLDLVPQPEDLVITSMNDGKHMEGSRHYTDEAMDLRSKNFQDNPHKVIFASAFQEFLGNKFRVILENLNKPNEHFHIQVRKGMRYP